MKTKLIAIFAFLPLMAIAQNLHQIYDQLNPNPTPEQILSESVRSEKTALYQKANQQLEDESERIATLAKTAAENRDKRSQAIMQQYNNVSPQQKKVQQDMANDLMQMVMQSGIPMEKLATMSEEEVMSIMMPMLAQNMGISAAELEKLSNMSDREAEAYIQANPQTMNNIRNSNLGQKAAQLEGISQPQMNNKDAELVGRIMELNLQMVEMYDSWVIDNAYWVTVGRELEQDKFADDFFAPYYSRIGKVYDECWDRINREHPDDFYNAYPMPSYAKSYYDQMNQIVDEANLALAKEWCKHLDGKLEYYRSQLDKMMPIYDEQYALYKNISDAGAKMDADLHMVNGMIHTILLNYVHTLQLRVQIPFMSHKEMPATYVTDGGMG